jgi:hypothetical protein
MNKTPKSMISKYDGHCNKCGRTVSAGEPILWLSRGVIECNDCTGGANKANQPSAAKLTSDKWQNAMAWDISGNKPAKPAQPRKAKPVPVTVPAETAPVVAAVVPADTESKIIDARKIVPADKPKTVKKPSFVNNPNRDAVSALVCDQLALLVNALDMATDTQRQTIRAYAEEFAADSVVPSRARIWNALATAAVS